MVQPGFIHWETIVDVLGWLSASLIQQLGDNKRGWTDK